MGETAQAHPRPVAALAEFIFPEKIYELARNQQGTPSLLMVDPASEVLPQPKVGEASPISVVVCMHD